MKKLFCFFIACVPWLSLAGEPEKGYATMDWTVAESLIALDEPPRAVGDKTSYQTWVMEPSIPAQTLDLGVRLQPNFELIADLSQRLENQPLVFINSQFYGALNEKLAHYGKVYNVDFYQAGNTWQNILAATEKIAQIIGKPQAYEALLHRYQQQIDQFRPKLQPLTQRPLAIVQFIDTRHLRIYGENSLFGAVAQQLGFHNAYLPPVNDWGFQNIEITELAKLPENTRFVVVKPYPLNIASALSHNTLWAHLPLAKDALVLPAVWSFGGIPSAARFAEILGNSLLHGGDKW